MPEDKEAAPEANAPEEKPAADGGDATALAAEVADLKDRLVRTLAEMENLRKRTGREISDARQYAVASFARDMLTVADNLRRAIDAVPAGERESGDKALMALIEGVEVTERGLEQSLAKFGVRAIDAKGTKFNPEIHQAMYEAETSEVPAGHVSDVVQTGYVIGERVLRPSLVGVAKAARKPPAAANDDDGKAEAADAGKKEEAEGAGSAGSEAQSDPAQS
ncbi:MAG: nucleotide exchange factor GrpE [Bauldia sp.]|uniref:nucleotide exchange factor GrpE n=1 Tax=Bauldia sp. TaxID=2575872 RepID=UPI001D250709|nr:nucleotide exchange factor GrpE [Bauldia sp.]MCB1496512.1 nucleotide exchange factor GrpE [Bauldia sp.]